MGRRSACSLDLLRPPTGMICRSTVCKRPGARSNILHALRKVEMHRTLLSVTALSLLACAAAPSATAPSSSAELRIQAAELRAPPAQLELQLMERDSVIDSLNARLDEALQEVVGAMGKPAIAHQSSGGCLCHGGGGRGVAIDHKLGPRFTESRQGLRLMQLSAGESRPELVIDCNATSASAMAEAASARLVSDCSFPWLRPPPARLHRAWHSDCRSPNHAP